MMVSNVFYEKLRLLLCDLRDAGGDPNRAADAAAQILAEMVTEEVERQWRNDDEDGGHRN
jgi:hypothetical protein